MCGSATLAEDIVHEAFVAVIDSAARYRPGQTVAKLWLLGHRPQSRAPGAGGRRRCRSTTKRRRPVRWRLSCARSDRRHRPQTACRCAPARPGMPAGALPRSRRAVRLHELSYADAAAALGCALGTVRRVCTRARAAGAPVVPRPRRTSVSIAVTRRLHRAAVSSRQTSSITPAESHSSRAG